MKPLIALTLLAVAAAVKAQTPAALVASPPPAVVPAAKAAKPPRAPKPAPAPNPALIEAKLSNGKTVHYDCSKKGNATKTACKK